MTTAEKTLEIMWDAPAPEDLLPNPHPGETIRHDFLQPWGMTPYRLAKRMGVPVTRIDQILKGRRGITADTALRLSRAIGCSPEFWLGLQVRYDLEEAIRARAADYLIIERYQHEGPLLDEEEDAPPARELAA